MVDTLLLVMYVLIGVVMAIAGIESFRDHTNPARIGTGLFWILLAISFAFGTLIPPMATGVLIVIIGLLAAFKQIRVGTLLKSIVPTPKSPPRNSASGFTRLVLCWQSSPWPSPKPSSAAKSASGSGPSCPSSSPGC